MKKFLNSTTLCNESGRSMTEMLGVLAIIGTLSISGIAGYTYAMNKHRANEIISSVSKMAMTATTEIDLHGNPSLVEFKDMSGTIRTSNGYTVVLTPDNGDGTFTLAVQDVPEEVCEKIIGQDWKLPYNLPESCSDGDNAMAFVFTDSLDNGSGGADSGNSGNETGNNDEPTASSCPAGTSTAGLGGYVPTVTDVNCYCNAKDTTYNIGTGTCSGATKPNACESNTDCNSGEFCYITSGSCNGADAGGVTAAASSMTYSTSPGQCKPVANYGSTTPETVTGWGKLTKSGQTLTWDAADNWCRAQGKSLISVEDVNCFRSGTTDRIEENEEWGYCCASGQSCDYWGSYWSGNTISEANAAKYSSKIVELRKKYGSTYFWTKSDYDNSPCEAFLVVLGNGNVIGDGRYNSNYALCK